MDTKKLEILIFLILLGVLKIIDTKINILNINFMTDIS